MVNFERYLITKFLERNYPVSRVKENMRFKRAIILDDGVYFLNDKNNLNSLIYRFEQILKIVFCFDENLSRTILKEFLNIT
jgi:hypothetical protein